MPENPQDLPSEIVNLPREVFAYRQRHSHCLPPLSSAYWSPVAPSWWSFETCIQLTDRVALSQCSSAVQLACQSETLLLLLSNHNRWWLAQRAGTNVSGLRERDRSLDYLFLWERQIAGILKSQTTSLKGRTTLWEKTSDLSVSQEQTWKYFYPSVIFLPNSNFQILSDQNTGKRQLVKRSHFTQKITTNFRYSQMSTWHSPFITGWTPQMWYFGKQYIFWESAGVEKLWKIKTLTFGWQHGLEPMNHELQIGQNPCL